jgi:hypothetical protein
LVNFRPAGGRAGRRARGRAGWRAGRRAASGGPSGGAASGGARCLKSHACDSSAKLFDRPWVVQEWSKSFHGWSWSRAFFQRCCFPIAGSSSLSSLDGASALPSFCHDEVQRRESLSAMLLSMYWFSASAGSTRCRLLTAAVCSSLQLSAALPALCGFQQPFAASCSSQQLSAAPCSFLQLFAALCSYLQVSATLCFSLHLFATSCNSLQLAASLCNSLQLSAALCSSLHLSAAFCSSLSAPVVPRRAVTTHEMAPRGTVLSESWAL